MYTLLFSVALSIAIGEWAILIPLKLLGLYAHE